MAEPVYRPVIWTAKAMFRALKLGIDVVGLEHIPPSGGAVISSNHTSYLDFVFAGVPADMRGRRLVRFMAKDSIFRHRIAGPLMRGMSHIPVDRDNGMQAYRDAVTALKAGELVGVFPEATMSRAFDIKEMKSGAVRMAVAADVPIIPMCVFGGHRILGYGHRDLSRGTPIMITVGEPMRPTRGEDPEALTADLRERMRALLDESVARYPVDGAGAWWVPARLGGSAPTLEEAAAIDQRVREERAARRAEKSGR